MSTGSWFAISSGGRSATSHAYDAWNVSRLHMLQMNWIFNDTHSVNDSRFDACTR